jgi:hypothetical protein
MAVVVAEVQEQLVLTELGQLVATAALVHQILSRELQHTMRAAVAAVYIFQEQQARAVTVVVVLGVFQLLEVQQQQILAVVVVRQVEVHLLLLAVVMVAQV